MEDISGLRSGQNHAPTATLATVSPTYSGRVTAGFRITEFRWHDLRHTWATLHRQNGTPTHELQRLGGWKTTAMVERYAHRGPDHLANAASRIDSSFGTVATF
jgi:integrase